MKWTKRVKSYSFITLVAILIWLYAEGQDVPEPVQMNFEVQLPSALGADRDIVVDFPDGSNRKQVQVWFHGSSAQLSKLQNYLGIKQVIELPITLADVTGTDHETLKSLTTLQLAPLIAKSIVGNIGSVPVTVTDLGISVEGVEPTEEVSLTIDRLIREKIRVYFNPENVLVVPPGWQISPAQVELTVCKSDWDNQPPALRDATAIIDNLEGMPEGVEFKVPARLEPPLTGPHVRLNPDTVDITFTIAKQRASHTVDIVTFRQVIPPSEAKLYDVTLDENSRLLHNVVVTGPGDLIERLKKGELNIVAQYELTRNDLVAHITSKPVYGFVIREVSTEEVVEVALPRRSQPVSNGPVTYTSERFTVTTETRPLAVFVITDRK